jgi:hypothetical protein
VPPVNEDKIQVLYADDPPAGETICEFHGVVPLIFLSLGFPGDLAVPHEMPDLLVGPKQNAQIDTQNF